MGLNRIYITVLFLLFSFCSLAQSHYPGQHEGKFAVADKLTSRFYSFDLQDVHLPDSRFKQNMQREEAWILSIPVTRLLHSFRTNAGIFSGLEGGYDEKRKLGGWESLDCELRGHTTGHILSGLALLYASTGDDQYKRKADSLVDGLAEVQKALGEDGFLAAFPQELINRNIAGQRVWAPWYTLHKILSGLIDQYLYTDNKYALEIASGMASWAYKKLRPLTQEQRRIMLRNEFGGINESFYTLYSITGHESCKWLGDFFYHNEVLDSLKEGKDILQGKHANTYIPKLIGLSRQYEIEGKGEGDSIAFFFWNTVIDHHSFVTGSNSDKESFFKPDNLSAHLSGYTGESCNVYNMLKLTRHLYCHTGEMKYADYYEKALFNHILGQQDPVTGMIAYFLPMLPGGHKVYSTPDSSFWCCVGSGFENQAKYGEAIYYHSQTDLIVNLFISSELNWKEKGIKLVQQTDFPEQPAVSFTVSSAAPSKFALNIRYPSWSSAGVQLKVNGKPVKTNAKPGTYIILNRVWEEGDKIEVVFPMSLQLVATPDNPNKAAVLYGPIVLAGEMGMEGMEKPAPYSNPHLHNDYYTYNYNVPADIIKTLQVDRKDLNNSIKPLPGKPLRFTIAKGDIMLRPLYDIHRERYVVYWDIN